MRPRAKVTTVRLQ